MARQKGGWSSLPADLVNRVADCFLATSDLDYYTDLRAVCRHWRSSTADPRSNQHDPRFRPSHWVLLNERELSSPKSDGACLFVNAATGRFLRRTLPALLLRDHLLVTTTAGGLLVLAARGSPHAARVLNPFTGSWTRFAAPLPITEVPSFTADVVGSSPTLFLASVSTNKVYWADPQSESFSADEEHSHFPASRRLPLIAAGKCAVVLDGRDREPGAHKILDQLVSPEEPCCGCYVVVDPAGEGDTLLAVLMRRHGIDVFKIDSAAGTVIERVRSIGSRALFLGIRCLIVDAHSFPAIEANCAYFQPIGGQDRAAFDVVECDIYKFDFQRSTEVEDETKRISAAVVNDTVSRMWPFYPRPFTVIQLLCNYTLPVPCSVVLCRRIAALYYQRIDVN
ncbi:hypothetical protein U9M48_016399 [Paspalum notatum var. saurae]|uniref:KIB1-4 beta-propeller domain-containing protein n=1 Tax=Paspalum notatum var. saurae TaxID=547442 RepID=A0AAQ3WMS6_PASNO